MGGQRTKRLHCAHAPPGRGRRIKQGGCLLVEDGGEILGLFRDSEQTLRHF